MIRENLAEEYYGTFGEYPGEEWLDEQMAAATAETAAPAAPEAPAAPGAPAENSDLAA